MADAISVERLTKELEKLHTEMIGGEYGHGEYDQRLARVIQELRDRGIDADRPKIQATIDDALGKGFITPAVKAHLEKRLGLA
jgi:hypothetical protein